MEQVIEGQDKQEENADSGSWISCPHCEKAILVHMKSRVISAEKADGSKNSTVSAIDAWRATLTMQQAKILEKATSNGLLESFKFAVERGPHNGIPKNMDKFFLQWLQMCRQRTVPAFALAEFKSLFPGTTIEFFGHGLVGGVLSNGEISLFLPIDLVNGTKVKTAVNGAISVGGPDAVGIRQWVKTRNGYVPMGAKAMLFELRKKSFGEFANPSL